MVLSLLCGGGKVVSGLTMHLSPRVMGYTMYVLAYLYGGVCGGIMVLVRMLVLLKYLVNSVSYALLKKLICSRINYLDMGEAMTSKGIRVSRIALKCEIGLL
jgi:hypothetical protein